MNRRNFFATVGGGALGLGAIASQPVESATKTNPAGPYSIEIVSPPQEAARELPLFDSYKQAENFAQARMNILRQSASYDMGGSVPAHEAGFIKVWSANSQVVFECSWGETWTMATS